MSSRDDPDQTYREFTEAVNMKPGELSTWLETEESKHVGWRKGSKGGESVGHQSGRRIIDLLRRKRDQLTEADYKHMRKVVGYVRRHMAQRPSGDVRATRWRYSLMNWGHDPVKAPLPPPGGPSRKALQRHGSPPKERRTRPA
ncbi:DUF3140 domain-containing protein [Micromonospora endophytica]|uniref:DNA-binding protein n=1 Tax=Micromonospora endophytica TaxID=515350 RepID=A0A2W2CET6_9ACTN|nr:DUF3140 domain-containing protein [Micromonospora endophytica]PZF97861.1 DNA-binding protein [Micromonospora endophytica]RIW41027.1 DUF3140 domain-containing protein [Micromonospora endophytica]BCJ61272.1 hypothetical protein Jiend_46940 [Micromonospora endophytica]